MLKINEHPTELDHHLAAAVSDVDVPTFGHFLEEGFVNPAIRRMSGTGRFVGRAVTVRTTGQDSTLVHYLAKQLTPTDVLFIDTGSDRTHAPVGGMVIAAMKHAGIPAVVIDGVCTDLEALKASGVSVYSRGLSTLTTKMLGLDAGGINVPVSIGGAVVLPGYLVVGDDNGVIAAPAEYFAYVLERAKASDANEPVSIGRMLDNPDLGLADVSGARAIIDALTAKAQR